MRLATTSLGQGTLPAHASLPRAARSRPGICAVTSDERAVQNDIGKMHDPEGAHSRWADIVGAAPQIRVRRAHDRARDQLADLAVLNERLAQTGSQAAEIEATAAVRRRVEYLKRRRRNWELVYQYVTQEDMLCTLASIEEANRKVEEALSEGTAEGAGVAALQRRLQELQKEVDTAQAKLDVTQNRVETNLKRIQELKDEAQRLQRSHNGSISAASAAVATPAAAAAPKPQPKAAQNEEEERRSTILKRRGLQSSLDLEDELRNHWFPVHFASRLQPDLMVPFELFGESWVLFRDENGRASCVRDECAHRACPLSAGSIKDGQLECPYHGWRFNGAGECTAMPSTKFCRGIRVSALPVEEADGFIWIWPGWREAGPLPMGATMPPNSQYTLHAELELEVPVEHGLLVENLLDLAHAPFTHTSTFARGWPVPEAVTFQAGKMLAGNWQPYPIDMGFNPPCMTESLIGLAKPGQVATGARALDCSNHLHQVHVCLPARRGHTRLLYRMSMDFMGWVRYVPGIQQLWKSVAGQVMAEDLVLVRGQQQRMAQGGDTWGHPVSYDKIAVRYRRWRNAIAAGGDPSEAKAGVRMSAGEMFVVEDDEHVYVD